MKKKVDDLLYLEEVDLTIREAVVNVNKQSFTVDFDIVGDSVLVTQESVNKISNSKLSRKSILAEKIESLIQGCNGFKAKYC